MGKRIEKAFGRDKDKGQAPTPEDDDPNKPPEPYVCTGNFANDFQELCQRNNIERIPPLVMRPHRPVSPTPTPAADEKPKASKKDDKKNQPPPEPEPEPVLDENGEPPPKTYTTKEKFDYFKPCIQVELDIQEKYETVTEIYIRGWKVDDAMMEIFKQCWVKLERLHTISLWNTGLTDTTLAILASFLPDCPNVKNLILDNNATIKAEEYDKLLLPEECPLQNLSLRYNSITDKGAELLGKALGSTQRCNMKLISLNLNGNKITDKGAEHLANGLRMNRTLLALSLSNNQIGDAGVKKFSEVISRFTLTHEEIVERRRLLWEKGSPDRGKSPLPGSRRGDSRDRPGSVRSTHAKNKGDKSATKTKKDAKGGKEDEKTKKKKVPTATLR